VLGEGRRAHVPQRAAVADQDRSFQGLFEALDRGEWLPAAAAMATVSGAVKAPAPGT
jgi:hypothetical protein